MLPAASSLELPDSLAGLAWLAPIECLELAKTWPGWLRKVVADALWADFGWLELTDAESWLALADWGSLADAQFWVELADWQD